MKRGRAKLNMVTLLDPIYTDTQYTLYTVIWSNDLAFNMLPKHHH